MPMYDYRCGTCEATYAVRRSMSSYDPKEPCTECGSAEVERIITPAAFRLKGGGWAGKALRVKNQRKKNNARLDEKQRERRHDGPKMTLAPNVGGESVESWADAQKIAGERGKSTASYDKLVREERSTK